MKPQDNLKTLLDDVLVDEELDSLRASLRVECHRELARKQAAQRRRWLPLVAAAALLLVMARAFFWTGGPDSLNDLPAYQVKTVSLSLAQRVATPSSGAGYVLLQSEMGPGTVVRSRPMTDPEARLHTRPLPEPARVATAVPVSRINDEELLALCGDAPCGLLTTGEKTKSLFFMHAEDEELYLVELGL